MGDVTLLALAPSAYLLDLFSLLSSLPREGETISRKGGVMRGIHSILDQKSAWIAA